jgi:N-acetylmuramoyl-L-alanine amidase
VRRIHGLVAALLLAACLLTLGPTSAARAAGDPIAAFTATAERVFTPDDDGRQDTFNAQLQTTETATISVEVLTWEAAPVATLILPTEMPPGTYPIAWDGSGVPNGPYRLRVTATLPATGVATVREIQVARVEAVAYPINPGAVTVFVDPGHGGDAPGGANAALPNGLLIRERDLNLDIALKLASMLRAAGVRVSLSRTADVAANVSHTDRNGDGKVDDHDEYLTRIDGANRVRADMFLAIHNNFISDGTGRTEAFYCGVGCVGPSRSRTLATLVLQAHIDAFTPLQTASWHLTLGDPEIPAAVRNPTDDYLRFKTSAYPPSRHFYYLGQYAPPFRPRALQMPAMLMESLALSDPTELGLLATPSIRTLIANAYYDGITRYLVQRTWGLRLDPVAAPTTARVGRWAIVDVRVTNNGNVPLPAGTPIIVGSVKAVSTYDGSPSPGTKIGSVRIAAELAPGASVRVRVSVRPTVTGDALWKVDAVVNGVRTSAQRVPFLQLRVRVSP